MKNTSNECLKYVIQNSRKVFFENGYKDIDSLESWLGQSVYYFYKNGTITGFSRDSAKALKDVNKNDILNFLIDNYLEKINNTDNLNIRDDFQILIKQKIENDGMLNTKDALISYISFKDINKFSKECRENILKYKPDSLLQSMGIITIKRVLQEEPVDAKLSFDSNMESDIIFASDFAVLSNGNYDIDKIVNLMEGIRRGKID